MSIDYSSRTLVNLVERTVAALEAVRLPFEMPGSLELEESRAQLLTQLKTRILPHLYSESLPTVIVLGGSSGAGKSTLFNSLVGEELSPASVIRPTTRTPYIAVHPDDKGAMTGHGLCEMGAVVHPKGAIPGIVLVDAPDLDSVDAANRELSRRLLDAADIWLFVTTPSRYGDALAWHMLRDAHTRGLTTGVLLNRVNERARETVRHDIVERMQNEGMGDTALMIVDDSGPHEGLLDPKLIADLRLWLERISATRLGEALVDRTTRAMLPSLHDQLLHISDAVEMQANVVQDLKDRAEVAVSGFVKTVDSNASRGRYGQGAPTTAWVTLASTGGALAGLARGDRPTFFQKRNTAERDNAVTSVFDAVIAAVRVGLTQALISAEEEVWESWRDDILDTEEYIEAAHARIDIPALVKETELAWKADLKLLAQSVSTNPWLSHPGSASLIGAAAGGVNGAMNSLRMLDATDSAVNARQKLSEHCENALNKITAAYCTVLDEIPIGNGRHLRLRAAEYADRYGL
ncbi:MAG: 50S ribosome-binding GTPase [Actinomycetaceae bacterium]|nr:50S ribosome-binding GTPase [Actinomycetaceae bacterium]